MPVAKPGPAAKTAKATVVAAAPVPRKTSKPATPLKTAAKTAKKVAVKQVAVKAAGKVSAKTPARKAAANKIIQPMSAPAAVVKAAKIKLVRDSFTIPRVEYEVLDAIKARLVKLTCPAKKSEVLRAGIAVLATLNDAALLAALEAVPAIKTGRPKKVK
jgi:hypothetical protein